MSVDLHSPYFPRGFNHRGKVLHVDLRYLLRIILMVGNEAERPFDLIGTFVPLRVLICQSTRCTVDLPVQFSPPAVKTPNNLDEIIIL